MRTHIREWGLSWLLGGGFILALIVWYLFLR